ncbi:DNA-directed RNA polymerase II subunit RPB3 [Neolecta irregularis DAH-3]|uniref:DNA-directed RNA polymerase II subunit RPB3 n=1 Tax=Neolecta irregularis (strain DAH-3) TaxID=1198029 RepID=A0A1U7LRU8_NEOID|nr:DNA-directed RNA polymerase II subunit RPB3 [Neolecta irregularis DAH-3]|eukprot:OLL25348.1 DNA-directed RNA polymerase II subunit RPB3 [Neolecta irregularis DAH-3]
MDVNDSQGPQVTIRHINPDSVDFILSNVDLGYSFFCPSDTSFANSLRRIIIAEVPTVAIDLVEIEMNTSVLADEFIAHRLGMIPLDSRKIDGNLLYTQDCDCDQQCDKCSVILTLDAKCTGDGTMDVSTRDLVVQGLPPLGSPVISDSEGKGVLICKLRKEQELKLKCIAKRARFTAEHSSCPGHRQRTCEMVPDYWFEEDAEAEWPKSANAEWEDAPKDGEPFDYNAQPHRFYFDVETVGQIPPNEVISQGIKYLQALKTKSRSFLLYTLSVLIGGIGVTYAAVPLYRLFCQKTGFAGTPMTDSSKFTPDRLVPVKNSRRLRITFNGSVSDALQWRFVPQQPQVRLVPGETCLAFYTAKNKSNTDIIGIATYNVTPSKVAPYFNKIQCFCFEEQKLAAGESVDMPVFFFIDPEFATDPYMKDVDLITLSYTFFKAKYDDNGVLVPVS